MRTDAGGVFRCAAVPAGSELVVEDPSYVTLVPGRADGDDPLRVVVSLARMIRGVVVHSASGEWIAEAKVTLSVGGRWSRRSDDASFWSGFAARSVRTDSAGRFQFEGVPEVSGVFVEAERDGYVAASSGELDVGVQFVEIELHSHGAGREVRGVVLAHDGEPLPGTAVSFGGPVVRSDERGGFALTVRPGAAHLVAVARGIGVRRVALEDLGDYVVIRMPESSPVATGFVQDQRGRPIAGARIVFAAPTPLGVAEVAVAGEDSPFTLTAPLFVEDVVADEGEYLVADSAGRFSVALEDPEPRPVLVLDPTTSVSVAGELVAGTETRFVLDREAAVRLRARVVDSDGDPVEGVDIRVGVAVRNIEVGAEAVRSDSDGWFEVLVPRSMDTVRLSVAGDQILPASFDLDRQGPSPPLTVSRRASVRLVWDALERGTLVTAQYPDGRRATIHYPGDGPLIGTESVPVLGRASQVFWVPAHVSDWRWTDRSGEARSVSAALSGEATVTEVVLR